MMRTIVVLFALIAAANAQTTAIFGSNFMVTATTSTDLTIQWQTAGITVVTMDITASGPGNIKLEAFASVSTNLAAGFTGLNLLAIGTQVGFTFSGEAGVTITACKITTAKLNAAAILLVEASGSMPGVLSWDASAMAYTNLAIEPYTVAAGQISVKLPSPFKGTYVLVAITAQVDVAYDVEREAYAGANQTINFAGETWITFKSEKSAKIKCTKATTTTKAGWNLGANLGVYLNIGLTGAAATGTQAHDSVIKYKYTAKQLTDAGISSANNLRFAFYNEATTQWEAATPAATVDASAMVATQATIHFSEWTVYGSNSAAGLTASIALVVGLALASRVGLMLQ